MIIPDEADSSRRSHIVVCLQPVAGATLPLVACFDLLIKGHILRADLYIGALTAPLVTVLVVAIINPYVEHIFRMKRRIGISQRISGIGSWEWITAENSVDFSEEAQRIFAIDPASAGFSGMLDRVVECDRERVKAYLDATCGGHQPDAIEFAIRHPFSGPRALHMDSAPLPDAKGRLIGAVGTVRDISERAEAEKAQQQAEAAARQFLTAIEQSPDAVMLLDCEGVIEYVKAAAPTISGYTAEELLGKVAFFLRPEVRGTAPFAGIVRQISQGESWHGRIEDRNRDGTTYPAYCFISPITDEQHQITHFVCAQQDLREKESLEKQLDQAQKMEALGTLVGGIAHDFNNMLGGITSNLFLARNLAGDNSALLEKLKRADALCFRSADMIKQLLAFARKDQVAMKDLSLNSFIKETMKLHASAIPENIRVDLQACAERAVVCADLTQMQQILLNLLNNASQALRNSDKPRITIRTQVLDPAPELLAEHPEAEAGLHVCLSVSDNGAGIDKQHLHRIFEPFFTTKKVGEGSGLGLSMVYGAVKRHKGFIEASSIPHKETTIRAYFPFPQSTAGQRGDLQLDAPEIKRGNGETILLVDDEAGFVDAHKHALMMLGYKALTASDGREAVRIFAEDPSGIDIILTDMIMPEM
ncbi:MAG: PAS domain S-box protein, partial [Mariprofundaceae bacterium]|nr:PAS domain S-box protein [Mariprofundaceae bacterium]